MKKAELKRFLSYMKHIAVSYEINPRDYKAVWRSRTIFNKFSDCLGITERKAHKEDLEYIKHCLTKACQEAKRKERKLRERIKDKLGDFKDLLDMFEAVKEMKEEEI